jgi:uncharacterized tellurite resistance protein B-like protein
MEKLVMTIDEPKLIQLGRILLGAGYADGEFHDLEREEIQRILSNFIHDAGLASRVIGELNDFDPDDFDVEEAVEALGELRQEDKQAIMSMLSGVTDADFTHDFAESAYVDRVAGLIGMNPEDYNEYTVELIEE